MEPSTEPAASFGIRTVKADDLALVYSAWLKQVRHSSSFAEGTPQPIYFAEEQSVLTGILSRPNAKVMIAHDADDPDVVLGWACSERRELGDVVHFVWVKKAFRRFGIGRALLAASADPSRFYYTRKTDSSRELHRNGKIHGAIYCPYWAFRPEGST